MLAAKNGSGRIFRWVLVTMLFAVAAVWSTRPVFRHATRSLPATSAAMSTVPLFNAWTIQWNADRLRTGMFGYWNAPIFHPVQGTFAFSEPQPMTVCLAPLVLMTGSPVLAYNISLWLSLILNGVLTIHLLRGLRVGWLFSVVGGMAMLLLPLVHNQIDVVQIVPQWGILWTLHVLLKLHRMVTLQRRSRFGLRSVAGLGVELGLAVSAVFACSVHHGLFLVLVLGLSFWLVVPWCCLSRWIAGPLTGCLVVGILVAPMLLTMADILKEHRFSRQEQVMTQLSAQPADFVRIPSQSLLKPGTPEAKTRRALSVGLVRSAFAIIGATLIVLARRRHTRLAVRWLLLIAVLSVLLSLGTNLQIGQWKPWLTVVAWCPGFAQVRNIFRFAYFVQMVVVLLSVLGLDRLFRRVRAMGVARPILQRCMSAVVMVPAMVIAVEVPPATVIPVDVADLTVVPPWLSYVQDRLEAGKGVLMLPYPTGTGAGEFEQTTRWMLLATSQHVPLVNGYSGFFPQDHFVLQRAFREDQFSAESLQQMAFANVQFVVVTAGRHPESDVEAKRSGRYLRLAFRSPDGTGVYELQE